jgi:iron-sulfur cluster repair protein YtfE (RIC family)
LLPLLVMARNNPQTIHASGTEMCGITQALDEMFRAHLQLEEEVIFPAIRQGLSDNVRAEMLSEMQGRRQQG